VDRFLLHVRTSEEAEVADRLLGHRRGGLAQACLLVAPLALLTDGPASAGSRLAAEEPRARVVMMAAPATVFEEPVWQAKAARTHNTLSDLMAASLTPSHS
jgi:hypothetical protein